MLVKISKKFGIPSTSRSIQKKKIMIHIQKCSQETPRQWTMNSSLHHALFHQKEMSLLPGRESPLSPFLAMMYCGITMSWPCPFHWSGPEPQHPPSSFLAFIADRMSCGMEYPFGQAGSAVQVMYPLKILPRLSCWCWRSVCETELMLCQHCSVVPETMVCYQYFPSKAWHCEGCYGENKFSSSQNQYTNSGGSFGGKKF